ncbi:MAG: ABC transporter ATP-binding protein [Methanospirillaceae archaeon]|nr:ABC transporter ATP-binding protein [Methanospirillaceae archaeon]
MLQVQDLHVEVGGKEILHGVNLTINSGETHVLMGPNGSGKSTFLMALMGFEMYRITRGRILFFGNDVTSLSVNERASMGFGLMFQRPPTIAGLKLGKLLEVIQGDTKTNSQDIITSASKSMNMEDFLNRDINHGFSGGEIKRSEILQMIIQDPLFIMLDEPESGVDLENIHLMGISIAQILEKQKPIVNRKKSGLIITHTGYILDYLDVDKGHVLIDGEFKCHGNPREILKLVKKRGYNECLRCKKIE